MHMPEKSPFVVDADWLQGQLGRPGEHLELERHSGAALDGVGCRHVNRLVKAGRRPGHDGIAARLDRLVAGSILTFGG